jgi:hypothetical protein
MSDRYHYNINIPIKFNPFLVTDKNNRANFEKPISLLFLLKDNKELLTWLSKLNLYVQHARFFQSTPHDVYNKHIDAHRPLDGTYINQADIVKLNFIYNSTGTTMRWYKLSDGQRGEFYTNTNNDTVMGFSADKVVEVYSAAVDTNCILDGGTIHDLTNGENNNLNRMCYSLTIQSYDQKKLTWDSAVKILESYIY